MQQGQQASKRLQSRCHIALDLPSDWEGLAPPAAVLCALDVQREHAAPPASLLAAGRQERSNIPCIKLTWAGPATFQDVLIGLHCPGLTSYTCAQSGSLGKSFSRRVCPESLTAQVYS